MSLFPDGALARFLWHRGVLLKDFELYVEAATQKLQEHAQEIACEANRSFTYLQSATTNASGQSKEDLASAIAEEDGITEGLICGLSVLELCTSVLVCGNRDDHKLESGAVATRVPAFLLLLHRPRIRFRARPPPGLVPLTEVDVRSQPR